MRGKNKETINSHIDNSRKITIKNNLKTIKMIADDMLGDDDLLSELVDITEIDNVVEIMKKLARKVQVI